MALIVRCPSCKANNELEEDALQTALLNCPSCGKKSLLEDYSVLMFCPHCRQKLAIPADLINEEEIYCQACDKPFKPRTSFSLNDDTDDGTTLYADEEKIVTQLFHPGDFFDKYEIISLLGKGGMGEVYLANHLLLNKNVAIKIMLASCAAKSPIVAKRFIREAKLANKIQSPNIIGVYDVGIEQTNNHLFIAMEYVNGRNLSEIMSLRGNFSESETLSIALDVCNALLLMETNHIVHRDIKPSNIMINDQKVVKLADLGIAKADSTSAAGELTLTADSLVFGTPNYASPEQCRSSHHTDTRSDIYSLGATMFHMVTGKAPFTGITPMDIMYKVLNEDPLDINTLAPHLSTPFKQLILDMMQKDPALRPQCIKDLQDRIQDIISGVPENNTVPSSNVNSSTLEENPPKTSLSSFLKRILPTSNDITSQEQPTYLILSKSFNLLKKALVIILVAFGGIFILTLFTDIKIIPKTSNKESTKISSTNPIASSKEIPQASTSSNTKVVTVKNTKEKTTALPSLQPKVKDKKIVETKETKDTKVAQTSKVAQNKSAANTETTPKEEIKIVVPRKLTQKEFLAIYEEIFFKDESLNSPEKFVTLQSRLDRTNKIISALKVQLNKNFDNRLKQIYDFQTKVKHRLLSQIKNHQIRNEYIAKAKFSAFETQKATSLITNYLIQLLKNPKNKDKTIEATIIKALSNKQVDPNLSITFSANETYYLPENRQNYFQARSDITIPLRDILTDIEFLKKIDLSFMISKVCDNPLVKIPTNPNYINTTFLKLGVDNLKNHLLHFSKTPSDYYEENYLEVGDNFNQYDKDGNSILHYIARTKSPEILHAALCSGVRINDTNDDEETALFWAARYNSREITKKLIQFGANENHQNKDGKKAKDYNVSGSFNNAIRNLDNDNDLYQAILIACLNSETNLKDALLYNFQTPIFHAATSRNTDLLKILLSVGANVNIPDYFLRATALQHFIHFSAKDSAGINEKDYEIISLLLKHGADMFTPVSYQNLTPFILDYHNSINKPTPNAKLLYRAFIKNFNHTKDLPVLLEKLYSPFSSPIFSENAMDKNNTILQDILQNAPRVINNEELDNLLPRVLGSLRLNKDALKILVKFGVNIKAMDINNKDALDYYFEYLCRYYRTLDRPVSKNKNNNSKRISFMSNTQLAMHKDKIRFLKSLGLSSQRSNYNIHPSVWKELY